MIIVETTGFRCRLRFFIIFMALFARGYYKNYNTLLKQEKKSPTNYINHERSNVRSDQRSLGFRVGHCHVQLTGVGIYIKPQVL